MDLFNDYNRRKKKSSTSSARTRIFKKILNRFTTGLLPRNARIEGLEGWEEIAEFQEQHSEIPRGIQQEQAETSPQLQKELAGSAFQLQQENAQSLNLELLEERLAFLDISCARLAEFVRKEARKREGLYSARERIQHKKRVNDYVMELAYNIKNEIELQELNITHTLHKKMIEIVRDKQQETRRAISRLQDGNKIYSLELRKRKERVVEIEKMHGKIFRLPKKLEIPIRRLKQEQVEPAMCLQENKFGSVRWLKQELVCSAQRLHQEQVKSTQSLQQEIERTLQTLFQGFVEITREVKQKYAEGSLRFPQTVARNAWKEAQAEIIQLKHRYAEITRHYNKSKQNSHYIYHSGKEDL
ncbi:hypothetical protein TNIN_270261 [Trichonephila inaurata madagascariensis]|uniref:Uncharacterized protein n=1 Tax=Trichonephila inaurata madagascariensis TaxID=2747483 RepID=A0A8X6X6G3_9ARAC|nr:hypothetical protein TNIN_270261 [Trichonephila inaurata madagascariensis]